MKPRNTYSVDGSGRHFTRAGLERYRRDLCNQLRRDGKAAIATSHEARSLDEFARQGGYVLIRARRLDKR